MSEDAPPQHRRLPLSLHKGFKSPTAHSPSPTPFPTPCSGKAPSQERLLMELPCLPLTWSRVLPPSVTMSRERCQQHPHRVTLLPGGKLREVHPCLSIHPFPSPPMASMAPAFPDLSHVNLKSSSKNLPSCSQPKKKGKKAWNKHGGGEWL